MKTLIWIKLSNNSSFVILIFPIFKFRNIGRSTFLRSKFWFPPIAHFKLVTVHFKMFSDQALIILPSSSSKSWLFQSQYDRNAKLLTVYQLLSVMLFWGNFSLKSLAKDVFKFQILRPGGDHWTLAIRHFRMVMVWQGIT